MIVHFSHNQIIVHDLMSLPPESSWSQREFDQGFSKSRMWVSFGTLLAWGRAAVQLAASSDLAIAGAERAIAVPIASPTGRLVICGPEDSQVSEMCVVEPGEYRLVLAQRVLNPDVDDGTVPCIDVRVFVEPCRKDDCRSEILVQDEDLTPQFPLLEDCENAQ